MIRRVGIILLCCILRYITASAIPDTARFQHFDLDNGFPSNNVYSVIQDKFGYLWFATDNGVVKYNGYSIRVFNTADGLPSNDVYQLYEDKRGRIWLNSISYQFGYIQDDKYHDSKLKTHDRIFKAYNMADNGKFLFLTYWEYNYYFLAVIGDDLQTTLPLYYSEVRMSGLKNTYWRERSVLRGAYIDDSCMLYLQKWDNSLYSYDLLHTGNAYRQLCAPSQDFMSSFLGGTRLQDVNGNFYLFRVRGNEILFYDIKRCAYNIYPFDKQGDEYIYTAFLSHDTRDKDDGITVFTNHFVYKFDGAFHLIRKDSLASLATTGSQIAYVFRDSWQNTWYTTTSDGAICKSDTTVFFDNDSFSLLKNTKFIGDLKDGTTFWLDKGKISLYKLSPSGVPAKVNLPYKTGITDIAGYNDSLVYLALKEGIFFYNTRTGNVENVFSNYRNVSITFEQQMRHAVKNDTASTIFFGGHFGILSFSENRFFTVGVNGLHLFDRYGDSSVCKVFTDERLTNLCYDSISHLIIAYNQNKILIFQPGTEKYFVVEDQFLKRFGINSVLKIEIDRYHNYFIKSDNDIFVYNPVYRIFFRLNTNLNLQNASFQLYNDTLYIFGRFGLAILPVLGPMSLGRTSYLPNIYRYNKASDFVISSRGIALLNTDKGVYKLTLRDVALKYVNDTFGFFKVVVRTPTLNSLVRPDTFFLNQSTEKINLDAVNLYGKGTAVFTYFIQDNSKDWQQSDGDIYIGTLPLGECCRIDYVVSDDRWSSGKHFFYVYRVPYWWQTRKWIIAFTISGIMLLLVLLLFVIFLTRRIAARANEKRRALTELELKAVYAQINPHFIFNTLNAAQYFISKRKFDEAYAHVSKFSRLLRAYLKSSQDRYITLDSEIQMLKNYIELQQIRFEEKFEYRIEVDNKLPVHNLLIPSLLLQPLVENAINHGLFHLSGGGLLVIKFLLGGTNDELVCVIEDNGVGRYRAREINAGDSTKRESYGTKLTRQLIDIYREYEQVDIKLEYIDKDRDETGTIVKLTVKKVKYIT